MSGTKSPSPKAPAINGSVIIVSHGQPSAPAPAEAELACFAAGVAAHLPGWHVGSATLANPGALDTALAAAGGGPLIYPMFMTEGWFTQEALPKRLAGRHSRVLAPFGTDPGLAQFAADLLGEVLRARGWQSAQTRLVIASHGSGRSPNSSRDTNLFATALAGRLPFAEMRTGFIEEPPYLADACRDLGAQSICLPFFAARGGHVIDDIPQALKLAQYQGALLDPIGCAPGVHAVVARALKAAKGRT